jgi:hypothetical protein
MLHAACTMNCSVTAFSSGSIRIKKKLNILVDTVGNVYKFMRISSLPQYVLLFCLQIIPLNRRICGFHSGDYEEVHFLGYNTV